MTSKSDYRSKFRCQSNSDGEVIRISVPALTEERRKELVKDVKNW